MNSVDIIEELVKPSILECVSLNGEPFKKRKTVLAEHELNKPLPRNELLEVPDFLQDIYGKYNGFRLFLEAKEHRNALFSMPEWQNVGALKLYMNELVRSTGDAIGGYKTEFPIEIGEAQPIGFFGNLSDMIVYRGKDILLMDIENICDNCCSISDLEAWESIDSFFEYLNENIMGLLSSYWRIDSDNGDQYAVENIIRLDDDRGREICGC